jgi:hypothetical protein
MTPTRKNPAQGMISRVFLDDRALKNGLTNESTVHFRLRNSIGSKNVRLARSQNNKKPPREFFPRRLRLNAFLRGVFSAS